MSTPPPTVVRIITWLPVGGIERRLVAVAPMLRDAGWGVRVVCIREEGPLAGQLRDAGVPVDVIPLRSRLSPPGIRRLSSYLTKHNAAVVHSHMYRSNIPGTLAGKWAGCRAIFGQVHNVDSWDTRRQILTEKVVCRWRTGTIAVSEAVRRDVMEKLGLGQEQVPLLYNGIDTSLFQPDAAARARIRAEWGVADHTVAFVVPARLHPQKNPGGVIVAFKQAIEQNPGRDLRLVFAGTGKLEEELRTRAEAELSGRVLFLGQRDDMAAIYNGADAVVLSSFKEGFSNAVVEALSCGKPMIASRVGGNAEAVNDARFGWIHEAGDVEALSAQMSEAATRGVEGLAGMSADCRRRAEDFSIGQLIRSTDALYRQALGMAPNA